MYFYTTHANTSTILFQTIVFLLHERVTEVCASFVPNCENICQGKESVKRRSCTVK